MAEALFYLLSLGAVGFGAGVVVARMPLFSVLSLLGTFFCLSGIYLLAGFQFLAATQLLVYAGAIMVLFLFVIMLLNLDDPEAMKKHTGITMSGKRLGIAAAAAGCLTLVGVYAAGRSNAFQTNPEVASSGVDDIKKIAEVLFSRYMLPFEAASLLLLATMVAVIVLAKRQRGGETQDEKMGWPWQEGVEQ